MFRKLTINHYLLITIIFFAAFLRFYKLNVYPAFNADEAAIGYNAYSLIETGMDEHGNPWPIHFQSFNDYKPGLYIYLVLPFVKAFGLNEWAVRLPNALLGVATVYLLYLLVKELFKKDRQMVNDRELMVNNREKSIIDHQSLAIVASFMLAISPWHLHFSRGGWEVNTATFFMVLGLYLFLIGKDKFVYLTFSFLSFVFSLYTYHSARIVVPLLILGMLITYREEVKNNLKHYIFAALFAFVLLLPLANDMLKPQILSRAAGVGLLADSGPLNRINEQRGEHSDFNGVPTRVFHNKAVNYSLAFFENWLAHYHGLFLFLSGDDIQRDKVPETGQMYILDAMWMVIGVWWMLKNINKGTKLIVYWLLIAPVAAALTFQSPHALRSENMVIPLIIISAIGFSICLELGKKLLTNARIGQALLTSYFLLLTSLIFWQFARYQHLYWIHMSKEYPYSSQYGVKELVNYVSENEQKYKNIVVTDRYDQPYILFLFYTKYPPNNFQNDHVLTGRDRFGFSTVSQFGKYVFTSIDWQDIRLEYPDSLIVGTKEEISQTANIIKRIYGTNGFEYFDVVAN